LENTDDPPLDAAAFLDPLDADDDTVALHRFVEMRSGDVDVAADGLERTLRRHESIAGRVRLQAPDVEVHFFRQAKTVPADLNQLARADEAFHVSFERGSLVAGNLENLKQLAHAGRVMHPLAHGGENLVA